jgi:ElaB/YqjD/DUF883 family membrane-anchored ribosome-binding protein
MTLDRPFGFALETLAELGTVDVNHCCNLVSPPAENISLFTRTVNLRSIQRSAGQIVEISIGCDWHSNCARTLLELPSNGGTTMKAEVLDRVTDLSGAAAQLEAGVGRMKEAVADAVEHGIATTKRSLKQGRQAAEDLVYDAEHHVKRHPLSALGMSFGVGVGLGAVIGFLLSRTLCPGR